ncbi:MAG: hypothetical protein IJV31_11975 [Clostridia bacterium]|nr:hypothetical protein [Clostridia bacterium]
MHNLLRLYNQNRKTIWKIIIIIISIIVLIRVLNYIAGINNKKRISNSQNSNTSEKISSNTNNNNRNNSNTIISTNKSLVEGREISSESLNTAKDTIDKFINYCNNGETQNAYDILTDECKELMYPTLNVFYNNYCKNLFEEKKQCAISNWTGNVYKVIIAPDALASGVINTQKETTDYITIVNKNGEYKLNINSYIGRTQINKTDENQNLEINVISKDSYMEYEIYNIQVKNNTGNTIVLDDLTKSKTIYLQDGNGAQYSAANYELSQNNMIVRDGFATNLKIQFSNAYNISRTYTSIVFTSVNFNYGEQNNKKEIVVGL